MGLKKKKLKDFVHRYDRSTRLVTVSGTNTQRSKRTSVFQRNQGIRKHCEENAHSHTIMDLLPSWPSLVSGPPPLVSQ